MPSPARSWYPFVFLLFTFYFLRFLPEDIFNTKEIPCCDELRKGPSGCMALISDSCSSPSSQGLGSDQYGPASRDCCWPPARHPPPPLPPSYKPSHGDCATSTFPILSYIGASLFAFFIFPLNQLGLDSFAPIFLQFYFSRTTFVSRFCNRFQCLLQSLLRYIS